MRVSSTACAATLVVASLTACVSDSLPTAIAPSEGRVSSVSANGSGYDIPIYGLGGFRRATPQSPCATGNARQFDFWVGTWKVYNVAGAFVATSRILNKLDGCLIEENWAPLNGLRGRSLNSYDAEAGVWRQTWVPENSSGGRPLRYAGGLRPDGVMEMAGVRHNAYFGFSYFDSVRWTPVDANHVNQMTSLDIPAFGLRFASRPRYERTTDPLPSTTSPGTTNCLRGGDAEGSRNLDFTVGMWRVSASNGLAVGTSSIVVDPTLSGCLIEENFSSTKSYRAVGWLYYDVIENAYYRTYVDSEGERVELRGTFADDALVMEGAEPVPGANGGRVRMTWKRTSTNELQQTWDVSRDDGATWRQVQQITFTRQ